MKGDLFAVYDLQSQDKAFQMAWVISQAYEIELNSSLYGVTPAPEKLSLVDKASQISAMRMSTQLRSSTASFFKRTLFISDHRNNQLNSRINKKADQENWDTTH